MCRINPDPDPNPASERGERHWNDLSSISGGRDGDDCESLCSVYFVHSYHVVPEDQKVIATVTDYGRPFVSSICKGNVMATQFHPEKSQKMGLRMLRNFGEI